MTKKLYAYSTRLTKQAGSVLTSSHTMGYSPATSEDEARGIAVRKANELKPGYDIGEVLVMEIEGIPQPEDPIAPGERKRLIDLLQNLTEVMDMTNPDHANYADSGADTVQALLEHEAETRNLLGSLREHE